MTTDLLAGFILKVWMGDISVVNGEETKRPVCHPP